jgi:hypothetical protein
MTLIIVVGAALWLTLAVVIALGMGRAIRRANHQAATLLVRARVRKIDVPAEIAAMEKLLEGVSGE